MINNKLVFTGILMILFYANGLSGQNIKINPKKLQHINLINGSVKIIDTTKKIINDNYELNSKPWSIYFKKIILNEKLNNLNIDGGAYQYMDKLDTLKIYNYEVFVGNLSSDSLIEVRKLNIQKEVNSRNFHFVIDLNKYSVLIFKSSNRIPIIYDLKSIKNRDK